MASLIRNQFHVQNAKNFMDTFTDGTPDPFNVNGAGSKNVYYIALMREGDLADQVWDSGDGTPDSTTDADKYDSNYSDTGRLGAFYWDHVAGFIKVKRQDITLATKNPVNSNNTKWETDGGKGNFYAAGSVDVSSANMMSPNIPGTGSVNGGSHYTINTNHDVYAITTPAEGATALASDAEPIVATPGQTQTSDGIVYENLYRIGSVHAEDEQKFLTDNFIPVNYSEQLLSGENRNAHEILGAKYVMINVTVPTGLTGGDDEKYRAAFLIKNPLVGTATTGHQYEDIANANNASYDLIATDDTYTSTGTLVTDIKKPVYSADGSLESGEVILWDNFYPIQRTGTSTEKHLFVIEF